jgi:dephospho-CoA kinase
MIVIGLTGGIGSGKSTVAGLLVERGAVLIDADELAREVLEPGLPAYAKVVEHFGDDVVLPDASLDRSAIAAKVFDDPQALAELNAIVHPEVRAEIATRLASEENKDAVVVVDIPLLVESGSSDLYGLAGVLVVDAPLEVVIERLVNRRQMSRADAEARIANQATRTERIEKADFVIMNMGTLDELEEMVTRAWRWVERLRADAAGCRHHGDAPPPPFGQT